MIEFRSLKECELNDWYLHCNTVFDEEDENYFKKHYEWDPFRDHSMIFVAVEDGVIASTARVFDRMVYITGRAIKMGGIGEVSTKPAYRKKGYAGTLLRMAIDEMERRQMPVSILFGNEPMYERMGWRFFSILYKKVNRASLPKLPEGAGIRPFQPEDLSFLMGAYDLYAGRLDGALQRSEAYWRQWVLPQWLGAYVLMMDGLPAAYGCISKEKKLEALRIDELCAAPQAEKIIPAFLRALAEEKQQDEICLHASLSQLEGETYQYDRMMIRANDPGLIEDLSQRWTPWIKNAGMFPVDMF